MHPSVAEPARSKRRDPLRRLHAILVRSDLAQRRHAAVAIPIAVFRKFADDRAARHAALVAYYGFFSLFPLLLVLVTVLGFAIEGNPDLQRRVLDSALGQFPIIGSQIRGDLRALSGSIVGLTAGLAAALWSGLAVVEALHEAMNEIWNVERRARASFVRSRLRALLVLLVVGVSLLASALLAGLGTSGGWLGPALRVLAFAGTLTLNVLVFAAIFRWLNDAGLGWRTVLPGAVVAGLGWAGMLMIGSWFVDRQIRDASDVYGFFAVVIGLLGWVYVGGQLTLLAAELNAVLERHLWPRSVLGDDGLTHADRRVLAGEAKEEAAHRTERIDVRFDRSGHAPEG